MPSLYRFHQVDVFTAYPMLGNPLAVVHDASGLDSASMAAFARWINLSETTFLLPATEPQADYQVRIFTPTVELPFAGHPTLGSAWAWLAAGGSPKDSDVVVQQCGAGLVPVRCIKDGHLTRLDFAAPPLLRIPVTGSLNAGLGQWLIGAGLAPERYVAAQGHALARNGRVHVERVADTVWVGGNVTPLIEGTVFL
jgi:predicted PhzF superfamily epimerase YddE/YHI9